MSEKDNQSRFQVDRGEVGSQLDDLAYSIFGPLTEYIIDTTDYREYTSRMTKPSRYYISRIFLDSIIAFLASVILFVIITVLFLGGFTSVLAPILTIFLEIMSIIPWIIAISYDSLNAVFAPIVDLISQILTSSGVSTIVDTLTGLPVIGAFFTAIFGVIFVISEFLVLIAEQVSPTGLESPEPNFDASVDLGSSFLSIEILGFMSLIFVIVITFGVFIYRVYYPIYYNNELNRSVETNRAESYLFLYAMTKGGLGAGRAMEELGTAQETYGMTADIFNSIVQRAKFSSMNLRDSIVVEARSSENEELSDFLYGVVNTMDTGSAVSDYLENKSKEALEEKRKDQESFFDILDIISETYVILVVVFPIFVLVIQLVSGIIGSLFNQFLLQLIPYMFIPAGGFVISIIVYVFGDSKSSFRAISKPKAPYELRFKIEEEDKEETILSNYSFNIFEKMLYKPIYTTIVTIPLIIIYMAVIIQIGVVPLSAEGWDENPMVPTFYAYYIPLIILFLPWSIAYEREKYRRSRLESQLISLLETVRASNERGLTLEESLATAADVEDDGLYEELRKAINKSRVTNQLDRNLVEFANEVRVPRISEAMYLITRANQVSGNISSVLETVTNDFSELYRIKKDRSRRAKEYASTILVALLVGIVLILALDVLFFDFILEQTPSGEGDTAASQAGVELFGNIPQGVFRRLFLHTVMSTSLTSGLVIGVMDNGRPENGLKYMIAFSTMGIIAFILRLSLI
jgi:flagellar protein FlaJ